MLRAIWNFFSLKSVRDIDWAIGITSLHFINLFGKTVFVLFAYSLVYKIIANIYAFVSWYYSDAEMLYLDLNFGFNFYVDTSEPLTLLAFPFQLFQLIYIYVLIKICALRLHSFGVSGWYLIPIILAPGAAIVAVFYQSFLIAKILTAVILLIFLVLAFAPAERRVEHYPIADFNWVDLSGAGKASVVFGYIMFLFIFGVITLLLF